MAQPVATRRPHLQSSSVIAPRRLLPTWSVLTLELIAVCALVVIALTDIPWWIPVIAALVIGIWFVPIGGRPLAEGVR